jgi:type IV pilus assembly protein PilO
MRLDELRNIDFRRVGNLSVGTKAAVLIVVFLVIVFGGWWFDWSSQLDEFDQEQHQETSLRDAWRDKKRMAVNLEAWRHRLVEIQQSFGALLRQLPNRSEMDALLNDINQAGLGRSLQFDLFKPAAQETLSDFYAELPVTLRVVGHYHELGAFASDLSHIPRIVLLQDMNISVASRPSEKDKSVKDKDAVLVMEATARTYRYLDEQELAHQQRLSKEKAGKK